jgi:hypothetical protein
MPAKYYRRLSQRSRRRTPKETRRCDDGIEGGDLPVQSLEEELQDGKDITGNRGDGDAFDGLPQFYWRERRRFGIFLLDLGYAT